MNYEELTKCLTNPPQFDVNDINKTAVLILGPSRAGKSTLSNLLINKQIDIG